MDFKVIGIYPEPIINHILHEYDALGSVKERANYLKNNRPFPPLSSSSTTEEFASGNTIDINPGELLGIGMVAIFYNWVGEKRGDTHQVIVGVEDTVKSYKEAFLSDGAIWHNQISKKMLFQTTMAQGFMPKKSISAKDVAESINKKVARRADYDKNCGLIINVFSERFEIDITQISKLADIYAFTDTYVVLYNLPSLAHAHVTLISHPNLPKLPIALKRHPRDNVWHYNKVNTSKG